MFLNKVKRKEKSKFFCPHKKTFSQRLFVRVGGGLSPSQVLSGREGSGPYVGGLFEYAACRVCVLGAGGVECENNS